MSIYRQSICHIDISNRASGAGAALGVEMLHTAQYWRDHRGCDKWRFGDLEVIQTRDGLVTVQRMVDGEPVMLRASPNNGKVRFDSRAMQVAVPVVVYVLHNLAS